MTGLPKVEAAVGEDYTVERQHSLASGHAGQGHGEHSPKGMFLEAKTQSLLISP